MTATQLQSYIGQVVTYWPPMCNGMAFRVRIKDAKMAYGKTRFVVEPVAGEGERWVEHVSLTGLKPSLT